MVDLTTDSVELEFLEQNRMVYLIKRFSEVQINNIGVLVPTHVTHDILNMVQELCEAALSLLESMLVRVDYVLGFDELNQF